MWSALRMSRKKSWSCSLNRRYIMAKEIIFIDTDTVTEEETDEMLKEDADAETKG